jgi:hypothetical protein
MGEGTLDLTDLRPLEIDTDVHASVGLGHLVVIVRDDQEVIVDTQVGAGETLVFGEQQNGVGFETHDHVSGDRRHPHAGPRGGDGSDRGAARDLPGRTGRHRVARAHHAVDDPRLSAATTARAGEQIHAEGREDGEVQQARRAITALYSVPATRPGSRPRARSWVMAQAIHIQPRIPL